MQSQSAVNQYRFVLKNLYKSKRDLNGVIQSKSEVDQEACIYADEERKLRQREYDNADLYSDADTAQVEQKERLQQNFISYFREAMYKRYKNSSTSILVNWKRALNFLNNVIWNSFLK